MANEERNALAELESELRFTLTDIQGECCEASYEAVAKASRILAELAKVMWYKAENGEVPFYPTGIGDIIWKCRAIAEEGVK